MALRADTGTGTGEAASRIAAPVARSALVALGVLAVTTAACTKRALSSERVGPYTPAGDMRSGANDRAPVAPAPKGTVPSASVTASASPTTPPSPPAAHVVSAIVAAHTWAGFRFGDSFECVLYEGGDVGCAHVELGHANADFRPVPWRDVVQLAAGESFVCALDRAGSVRCLGQDPCTQLANTETPTFEASDSGDAQVPRALPFAAPIVELRANEGSIVLRSADQRIHVAGLHDPYAKCAAVVARPVPDVRSFVHLWGHAECSLDIHGLIHCRTLTTTSGATPKPMTVSGFPAQSIALLSGQSTSEGGPTLCAIGAAGELSCAAGTEAFTSGARIALPAVRDAAIGSASLRVLTRGGDVYDLWWRKTPTPMRGVCARAPASAPTKVKVGEPIAAITTGSCMLTRSGNVVCVRPGCE